MLLKARFKSSLKENYSKCFVAISYIKVKDS